MIVYVANRGLEILGYASTQYDSRYIIMNDSRVEDVENASETLSFELHYRFSDGKEVKDFMQTGFYLLVHNKIKGDYRAYEVIETENNLAESYISVYAESAGLDLLNSVAEPYYLNEDWIALLYQTFLGRKMTKLEIKNEYWLRRLTHGTVSDAEILEGFYKSKEYKKLPRKTFRQFVTLLYKGGLGRDPSTAEIDSWDTDTKKGYATRKETLIYISKPKGTKSVDVPKSFVDPDVPPEKPPKTEKEIAAANKKKQNKWTQTKPPYDKEYPVLFTAKQRSVNRLKDPGTSTDPDDAHLYFCSKPLKDITLPPSAADTATLNNSLQDLIIDDLVKVFTNTPEYKSGAVKLRIGKHDIEYYVNAILKGEPDLNNKYPNDTGFRIGLNEIGTSKTIAWEWPQEATVANRLLDIASVFECEIYYSFAIEKFEITKRTLNIIKKRGKNTKIELRLGREVSNIRVIESNANLITAIKPIGAVPDGKELPVTLKGYKYTDENNDFYIDGETLKSRNALEKWARYNARTTNGPEGHLIGMYTSEAVTQKDLFDEALAELKTRRETEINVECEMLFVPDGLEIGDRAYVLDDNSEFYFEARILRYEVSESNDTRNITLGEYLITNSGISKKVENLAAAFERLAESRTFYTWIAYADDVYGTNISLDLMKDDGTTRTYVGIAPNRLSPEPIIDDPSIYSWTIIDAEDIKIELATGISENSKGISENTRVFEKAMAEDIPVMIDDQTTVKIAEHDVQIAGKYATKTQASAEQQRIYISKASGTTSVPKKTDAWVTKNTNTQGDWTIRRPQYNSNYPVLFTALQKKTVDGTITCTTPIVDDTLTVIDGGHITTGAIDAGRVSTGTMSAARIKGGSLKLGGESNENGSLYVYNASGKIIARINNAGAIFRSDWDGDNYTETKVVGGEIMQSFKMNGTVYTGGYIYPASAPPIESTSSANKTESIIIASRTPTNTDGNIHFQAANICFVGKKSGQQINLTDAVRYGTSINNGYYMRVAGDLVIQWGYLTLAHNTTKTVTLPYAFKQYQIFTTASCRQVGFGAMSTVAAKFVNNSSISISQYNGASANMDLFWIAVGK